MSRLIMAGVVCWLPVDVKACVCRQLRHGRQLYPQSFVVRQGSQMEMHVLPFFVEDRGPQADGYIDYMLRMHKAVLSGK